MIQDIQSGRLAKWWGHEAKTRASGEPRLLPDLSLTGVIVIWQRTQTQVVNKGWADSGKSLFCKGCFKENTLL